MIDTPLRPTHSTSNAIRPTSPEFAPPTARAKTQAHHVYSSPISTVSKLCGTSEFGEDDPNTNRLASATVCTRLNPIAARFTHSQPGVPTGVRVFSILLFPLPQPKPNRACQVHNALWALYPTSENSVMAKFAEWRLDKLRRNLLL